MVTFYMTVVQCQNKEMDISTILLGRLQIPLGFYQFYKHPFLCMPVCVVLCHLIPQIIVQSPQQSGYGTVPSLQRNSLGHTSLTHPWPSAITALLCIAKVLSFEDDYKWNNTMCNLFRWPFITKHNTFQVVAYINYLFLFLEE